MAKMQARVAVPDANIAFVAMREQFECFPPLVAGVWSRSRIVVVWHEESRLSAGPRVPSELILDIDVEIRQQAPIRKWMRRILRGQLCLIDGRLCWAMLDVSGGGLHRPNPVDLSPSFSIYVSLT